MKVFIKKESFKDLIENLLKPAIEFLYLKLKDKVKVESFLKKIKILHILLLPFFDEKDKYEEEITVKLKEVCIDDLCKEFMKFILPLYEEWLNRHAVEIAIPYLNKLKQITEEKEDEIDFFDLDEDNEIKDTLNSMHYDNKISAKDFMENNEIDFYFIDELKDLIEDYFNISNQINKFDYEDKQLIKEILSKFITIFSLNTEFLNLSKAIESLMDLLDLNLDNEKEAILKNMLDAIIQDLNKWYEEVIVYQNAKDIHYLDASLMSSIFNLKNLLKGSE